MLISLSTFLSQGELYLQSNQISRIESLDGCPKLQRLWLTDNRIIKIENIHALNDLRELYLQGNRIARCVPTK